MAKGRKAAVNTEEESNQTVTPNDILNAELKANKDSHYNFVEEIIIPKVSSGSLNVDLELGGGYGAGLQRFVGFTESGKSSSALELMRNFFIVVPKGRGVYVKAEGRLSEEVKKRSGLKFVYNTEEWSDGTCFVLETNTYDLVVNIMRQLIFAEDRSTRYFFLLDSMDGLILKSDLEKEITEAGKVAGAPALTKKFLQRCSNAMNKFGHICVMIGQVSAKVEIDPYAPKDTRQISATGGNAALHFANWIVQFEPRNQGDLILENPNEKPDLHKNRIIGHLCKIILKKTPNEKSNVMIKYPIRYNQTGGNSVWKEYEIVDIMLIYRLLTKKGAWVSISEELVKEAAENGLTLKEQHNGQTAFRVYLEENPELTTWLFNKLKATISS